ncbi:MAG: PD-(D/E)XK motif protein [Prevotella sp.]|nr:PD-(D/E)XK motif protein [Prevotella sp.]
MMNSILHKFRGGFQNSQFQRVGENRDLRIYIGKDEQGRFSFDFRGKFTPARIVGAEVIVVTHLLDSDTGDYYLRFSLANPELLEHFCTFCQDLIDTTESVKDDVTAYKKLCGRFVAWKKLFKPSHGKLTEFEIMGLIGELLFLRDRLFPKYGCEKAISSWMGQEKTHKDFSADDMWYEIKTTNVGKENVHISSIEQLDSDTIGYLVVYGLERMSPTYDGVKLNSLVFSILGSISSEFMKEVFMEKLSAFDYNYNEEYDNLVYEVRTEDTYEVRDDFPRMKRCNLPMAIGKAQYEILLTELESFKK